MKKTFVMIMFLPGMMLGGYLYGKQLQEKMHNRYESAVQHMECFGQFAGSTADSLRSGSGPGEEKVPDISDRLTDVLRNLEDFSCHFNDSAQFHEHFQEIFGPEFRQKLENIKADVFNERFFERLQENIGEFQKKDFRIELNKEFREQLQEKLEEMRRTWEELDQQMQEKYGRGRPI